jgi:hypothetical protein
VLRIAGRSRKGANPLTDAETANRVRRTGYIGRRFRILQPRRLGIPDNRFRLGSFDSFLRISSR